MRRRPPPIASSPCTATPARQSSIMSMYASQTKRSAASVELGADPLSTGSRLRHLTPCSPLSTPSSIRCGMTLIEVVASTMIVGMMTVAALNALGAATRSAESLGNRSVAAGLADELMSEIVQTAYSDPSGSTGLGPDGSESTGPRSAFDDVDDYDGWNQLPPQNRDGTTMPDRADWRHRVEVL